MVLKVFCLHLPIYFVADTFVYRNVAPLHKHAGRTKISNNGTVNIGNVYIGYVINIFNNKITLLRI